MAGRRRRTAAERRMLVEAWRRSGETQRAFSRGKDFSVNSLARWVREVRESEHVPFVEVVPEEQVQVVVVLPSGVRLELSGGVDTRSVAELVRALC